jgi:hypothetical protein
MTTREWFEADQADADRVREWPVTYVARIGRCGFCGERPVIDWTRNVPPAKTPTDTDVTP